MNFKELTEIAHDEKWSEVVNYECAHSYSFFVSLNWEDLDIDENIFDTLKEKSEERILDGECFDKEEYTGFQRVEGKWLAVKERKWCYEFVDEKVLYWYSLPKYVPDCIFSPDVVLLLKWGNAHGEINIPDLEQKSNDWKQFAIEHAKAECEKRREDSNRLFDNYIEEYEEKYGAQMKTHLEMVSRKNKIHNALCYIMENLPLVYSTYETLPSDMQHYGIDMKKMEEYICEKTKKLYEYARLMRQAKRQLCD